MHTHKMLSAAVMEWC